MEEKAAVAGVKEREKMEEQWRLYEAFNELHGLAQEFSTPFEAPAILVVGHQTDGKSALVEALMGFQFNHVGGGTKTRRPITLHMKYNPDCESPLCFLVNHSDSTVVDQKSLEAIQAFIEAENMRLESEPCQFSSKEIIIKVEYKYCPNLTIIDTPGLIAPAPARKIHSLQAQAAAVESLVRAKMQHKEYIILCLEDCSDWSIATTRRVVMQVDSELSRTVIVSTKLDTKIPQFARASDVEVFLSPPACTLDGFILGDSPFFTSVPSGRVGSSPDSVYRSNDEFKKAISLREVEDISCLEEKLGRTLSKQERSRIGISSLRLFLEELLQKRYINSVPLIIPLLEKEHRNATRHLNEIDEEFSMLNELNLKEKGRRFHDQFLTKLSLLLKGSIVAPPDKFGETLQDERVNGGAFTGPDGLQFPPKLIPNAGMRLYGGAQYHRAMAEFRFVVGGTKCPQITREEIVNACGVEDIHDGTNYSRTACVIAVSKARDTFEPFLHQLGHRLLHILKRLLPICIYLLQKDGEYLSRNDVFLGRVDSAFNNFAESTERSCREKCMEDLVSTTRYVSWSLHNKNRAGLRHFLDSFGASATDASVLGDSTPKEKPENSPKMAAKSSHLASGMDFNGSAQLTETRLADLLDNTLWNRRLAPSSERIVYALVQQIFHGIKEYFLASAELKFNCFLLMPIVDKLPERLRTLNYPIPSLITTIILVIVLIILWKAVNGVWLRPKKMEKLLRRQGFKGNPYKLIVGDVKEIITQTKAALRKPISLEDDHLPRIVCFIHDIIQKHGEQCFAWMGPTPWLIITNAEKIKDVLIKYEDFQKPNHPFTQLLMVGLFGLEGDTWVKHRRIINPAFHMDKLKSMFHLIHESCSLMTTSWEEIISKGGSNSTEIDVWPYLESLTGDIISRVAFGSSYEKGRRICDLQREQVNLSIASPQASNYIPGWRFLPTKKNRRVKEICKEIEESLTEIIDSRKKEMEAGVGTKDDLLGILLESSMREIKENGNEKGKGLTTKEVVDECKIFYLAGSETTSTLIVWALVLMSKHQIWQERARAEVLQLFGKDEIPTFQGLSHLKIVTMILNETLRLYTPAYMLLRKVYKDTKLQDVLVPAGTEILLPLCIIHQDINLWGSDAKEFNPERFAQGISTATKGQPIYYPFSTGPRFCIGQNLSLLEAKLTLAMILQRFSFAVSPTYIHAPHGTLTVRPQHGANLILTKI